MTVFALSGCMAAPVVGNGLLEWGVPPIVAMVGVGSLGLCLAVAAGSMVQESPVTLGFAGGILAWCLVGLPAHEHLLRTPFSSSALAFDVLLLVWAAVVGGLAALVHKPGQPLRGLVVPVVACGVGWALAWPVLDTAPPDLPAVTAPDKPPVVVIAVENLRPDRLPAYGYERDTAPAISDLGRRGVRYQTVYSPTPWGLPGLASVMTGRTPGRHGAGINNGKRNLWTGIRTDVPTLASRLKAEGYVSAAVVASPWASSAYGFDRGFAVYDDASGAARAHAARRPAPDRDPAVRLAPVPRGGRRQPAGLGPGARSAGRGLVLARRVRRSRRSDGGASRPCGESARPW